MKSVAYVKMCDCRAENMACILKCQPDIRRYVRGISIPERYAALDRFTYMGRFIRCLLAFACGDLQVIYLKKRHHITGRLSAEYRALVTVFEKQRYQTRMVQVRMCNDYTVDGF